MSDPTVCCYHFPCLDGFTAAWTVWRKYGNNVRYVPCNYDKPAPFFASEHVLIVDFSFNAQVLQHMVDHNQSVTILDHHKTAQADLQPFLDDGRVKGLFDMDRCGASITWEFLNPGVPRPMMIPFVEDYDLWRLAAAETKPLKAYMTSFEYGFNTWEVLAEQIEDFGSRAAAVEQGQAIDRAQAKSIRELLSDGVQMITLAGVEVPVANLPYQWASDGAGQLAETAPFAACYYDKPGARIFSLRSRGDGMDVSEVARRYGGGGHRGAAGFRTAPGWLGD